MVSHKFNSFRLFDIPQLHFYVSHTIKARAGITVWLLTFKETVFLPPAAYLKGMKLELALWV